MKPLRFKGDNIVKKKRKQKKEVVVEQEPEPDTWVSGLPSGPTVLYNSGCVMHFVEQSNKLVFKEGELKEPDQVGQVFLCHMLDDKLVLKNYLEKCLTATKYGNIECYKDAVGEPEMWKLVTLEDGFALQSMFGGYLGRDGDALRCDAQEISESETFKSIIQYRAKKKEAKEELKLAVSIEKELFQSYHAKGMGSHTVSLDYRDVQHLEKARKEGRLHEELVKKREKLKSDKFCK